LVGVSLIIINNIIMLKENNEQCLEESDDAIEVTLPRKGELCNLETYSNKDMIDAEAIDS